ncbi:hypothetical protein AQJ91_17790 [Streptomyces dysideae]|uniref:Uncharacterized protein n=1 Tax=Streptomyces dysideae TaxID=909626 RepID=A0A101UZN4_9ACTN|nr:hypothetical protein AQJ91_17790 [Streptomyces dysideae]
MIHRSGLFSRFLLVLVGVAVVVLCYSLLRENLPDRVTRGWPWQVELLDVQSAVAAVLATGGASLARAQYARTVRPAIGYFGRVVADVSPDGRMAWVCHLCNGGQEVAVTMDLGYWIEYTPAARASGAEDSSEWVTQAVASASVEGLGLMKRQDFALNLVGPGWPISGQQTMLLGWFTEKAMREVENVFVRVRVLDRVGDTHERVVSLLKGADRVPRHPDTPLF